MNNYPYDLTVTYSANCQIEKTLYFSHNAFNGLFKYDITTGEIQFLSFFEGESVLAKNIHLKAFRWKDIIVFVPLFGKRIALYNYDSGELTYIDLQMNKKTQVVDAFLYEDKLLLFFASKTDTPMIIKLDAPEDVRRIPITDSLSKVIEETQKTAFFSSMCLYDGKVYGAIYNTDAYLAYDLRSESFEVKRTGISGLKGYGTICRNENMYITGLEDFNIYRFNLHTGKASQYSNPHPFVYTKIAKYAEIVAAHDKVLAFPNAGDSVLYLEDNTMTIEPFAVLPDGFGIPENDFRYKRRRFYTYTISDGGVFTPPYSRNMSLEIDPIARTCVGMQIRLDEEYADTLFRDIYKEKFIEEERRKEFVQESKLYTLTDFIKNL